MKRVRIGVIGCGVISGIYFQNLTNFEAVEVVACADLNAAAAQAVVDKYPSIKAVSTEALLADPTIEIVLNLTQPKFHNEVMRAGIAAGKHVYGEKPLAVEFEESAEMMVLAEKAGVRATVIGVTGGAALTLEGSDTISIERLKSAHEDWLPAYMAGKTK